MAFTFLLETTAILLQYLPQSLSVELGLSEVGAGHQDYFFEIYVFNFQSCI